MKQNLLVIMDNLQKKLFTEFLKDHNLRKSFIHAVNTDLLWEPEKINYRKYLNNISSEEVILSAFLWGKVDLGIYPGDLNKKWIDLLNNTSS